MSQNVRLGWNEWPRGGGWSADHQLTSDLGILVAREDLLAEAAGEDDPEQLQGGGGSEK